MIDPARSCLFIPEGLRKFKLALFERIGEKIKAKGGCIIRGDIKALADLSDDIIPIVGCTPSLRPLVDNWIATGRKWIYWDRGYARRVFATWLPKGEGGGYYRWHVGAFQLNRLSKCDPDRWKRLNVGVDPWKRGGRHIVIAAPSRTYSKFHQCESWIADTIDALARVTDRQLVIRDKESKRSLQSDLLNAHALVTHGSISAVESAILGCPVFVDKSSAAALVGSTDLKLIESPVYPDRREWLNNLAWSQFNEQELVNGFLWEHLS